VSVRYRGTSQTIFRAGIGAVCARGFAERNQLAARLEKTIGDLGDDRVAGKEPKQMDKQDKIYTSGEVESSGRGEIFRAVLLVREAAGLLKTKATHLPDSAPSARLQRIATGFSDFGDSLERVAAAIERGHHRKLPRASEVELDHLATSIRRAPIGSRTARDLRARRALLREQIAAEFCVEEDHISKWIGPVLEEISGARGVA
jgi:hypothetical protein